MRKLLSAFIALVFMTFAFTGCSGKSETFKPAELVSVAQLNTDSTYLARGFFESLFTNDEVLFTNCFPEGYVESFNDSYGDNFYEVFKNYMMVEETFMGSVASDYKVCSVENGYDVATMRSNICRTVGCEYGDIGEIRIQKIQVQFMDEKGSSINNLYFEVYEQNGLWYFSRLCNDVEF